MIKSLFVYCICLKLYFFLFIVKKMKRNSCNILIFIYIYKADLFYMYHFSFVFRMRIINNILMDNITNYIILKTTLKKPFHILLCIQKFISSHFKIGGRITKLWKVKEVMIYVFQWNVTESHLLFSKVIEYFCFYCLSLYSNIYFWIFFLTFFHSRSNYRICKMK